ncbi:MAG: Ig-like domain repeat protein, partial [Anaerolineales bacterium]|nr:Ig-like domain repeat protein [Anaerolineales bacterium]
TFSPGTFSPQELLINSSVSGTWSWTFNATDGPSQTKEVTITATTSAGTNGYTGNTTSISFPLVVDNVPPSATFANNGPVNEGSSATVTFSNAFDPSTARGGDTYSGFHYAYDFDNDGVFEVGDGTYAGSSSVDSATVPTDFLVEGPDTHIVSGRIIDKDDGFTDYTTDITINNVAPIASISGPSDALVGQLTSFVVGANDGSTADQAIGFGYSIDWGDGSPIENITRSEGNGSATTRHAYAATGTYTAQVTATDRDGGTSTPASISIQVNALNATSLQTLIATEPFVEFAPADDAAFQNEVAAINDLNDPGTEVAITLILGVGPYSGVTLSPPDNIILDLAGNDTDDSNGTLITGNSPAVTVTSGEVFIQGNQLTTATDDATVLVTGGHLTLDQVEIQESTGFNNVAVRVTGGSVNLGFNVLMNVNGDGGFVDSYVRSALVPHPEGIDAELTPNTFQVTQYTDEGELIQATIPAVSLSSTSVSSSAPVTTFGENVTFMAIVDVKAIEHGPATGTVRFYNGETLLGEGAVTKVGGQFVAEFTTDVLSVGVHEITAVYSGDEAYVASSSELTHEVIAILADLSVTKSDDADPVNNEDLLTYTIVVTNHGPAVATDVALIDTLPEETELISFTSSLGICLEEDDEIVCDLGDLADG